MIARVLLLLAIGVFGKLEILVPGNYTLLKEKKSQDFLVFFTNSLLPELKPIEAAFLESTQSEKTAKPFYILHDCHVAQDLCQQYNVTHYPTLKHFYNGAIHDYEWELTYEDFHDFGMKLSLPPVLILHRWEKYNKFRKMHLISFMCFYFAETYNKDHLKRVDTFRKLAEEYRHTKVWFAETARREIRDYDAVAFNQLPMIKQFGMDEPYSYNITFFNETSLRNFVEEHKFSMLLPLNNSYWNILHREMEEKKKVLNIAFVDSKNVTHMNYYANNLKMISWDHRAKKDYRFQSAYLDILKYPSLAAQYKVHSAPTIVSIDFRDANRTVAYYTNKGEKARISNFLNRVWERSLGPEYYIPPTKSWNFNESLQEIRPVLLYYGVGVAILHAFGLLLWVIFGTEKQKKD